MPAWICSWSTVAGYWDPTLQVNYLGKSVRSNLQSNPADTHLQTDGGNGMGTPLWGPCRRMSVRSVVGIPDLYRHRI